MRKVEIVGRIPEVPGPLIEAIRDADLKFARSFGEKCVENNCLKQEELDIIVGVTCWAKAYQLSQGVMKSLSENKIPPEEVLLTAHNLFHWGSLILQKNLPKLKR